MQKTAIFNESDQAKLLEVASETEYIPLWLMLEGMHTHDVVFRDKIHLALDENNGAWLTYSRCKTGNPRRIYVPCEVLPKLITWLRFGRRASPDGYHKMVRRVGERAGLGKSITPMTLRHSAALNCLRKFKDSAQAVDLVSKYMGCSRNVALRYYLDYEQMSALSEKKKPGNGFVVDLPGQVDLHHDADHPHVDDEHGILSKWSTKYA